MKREIITIRNGVVSLPASGEIWMTQHQIAYLFGCFVSKVNANIRAILKSEVLDEARVCRTCRYRDGGGVMEYNLEMITALAFRIESRNAEIIRRWLMRRATRPSCEILPILVLRSDSLPLN